MDPLIKTWEPRFQKFAAVLLRMALGYLFFTQLWWKTPPTFGCPPDFKFTAADTSGKLKRTSGLCDWIGIESVWASRPHPVFVANLDNKGNPEIAIDIGLLAKGNGAFLEGFVKPNIRWFGYAIFGMEAFIFVTMFFGLFTRLGALVALAQSAQLWVGLSGIGNPFEWEWSYNLFVFISLWALAYAPGRVFGLDVLLRARLLPLAEKGNRAARVLLWLT
jgi:hypothetical protein